MISSIKHLPGSLPPLPIYRAQWMPVYWEPMRGSDERLTVAIAARGEIGEYEVHICIRPDILRALYGRQGEAARGLITLVADDLAAHLRQGNGLSEWQPPITGVYTGSVRPALADDLRGVIRQALTLTSSLAHLADVDQDRDDDQIEDISPAEQWRDAVKSMTVTIRPELGCKFDVSLPLYSSSSIETRFGFLCVEWAAQFDVIRPDQAKSRFREAQRKLWTLKQAIATNYAKDAGLVLLLKDENDLSYSPKQHRATRNVLIELREQAKSLSLNVIGCHCVEEASNDLLAHVA
jgi:hypothetical protein